MKEKSSLTIKNLSIFGLGKLGAVAAGCYASRGFHVIGVEINQNFVELRNELTDNEKRIRREKEEALKEALKGEAQRKLSKGEKLTLYELGALYEGEEE